MQLNNVFQDWLRASHISEETQKEFNISFDGHIIIPVNYPDGEFSFNKYRRSPLVDHGPKYWYDKGGKVTLFGADKIKEEKKVLIVEGEKDCLVAWSHNIPTVTSTGGAMSFQEHWVEMLEGKEVVVCFDNDLTGCNGAVKLLGILPEAKIVFVPTIIPGVKDISDYVAKGGDLPELLKTARGFESTVDVREDMLRRIAICQDVKFHEAYLKEHTKLAPKNEKRKSFSSDDVTNAKEYPVVNLMEFNGANKAVCPFHNEKTPSLVYYKESNSCYCFGCSKVADSIDIYMKQNGCSFKDAVKELNNK